MPNASIDAFLVRDRFNMEWVYDPENSAEQDTFWWWACSVRVDPNEVIADDGEGHLWSVPFTTDGIDAITFGTPVRVAQTFVPVGAGDGAAASALVGRRRQQVLASALDRPTKPDPQGREVPSQFRTPAATERHNPEEDQVTDVDLERLRARLGLDEGADVEQINAALSADAPETFTAEQVQEQVAAAETAVREEERQRAAAVAEDTVHFDRATAEQLRADAAAGREAREQQIGAQRDQLVAAAVEDGRIPPARREHWRHLLDADPEGAAATLGSLEKGLIPVSERGVATAGPDDENPLGAEANLDHLFPQLQSREG